MSCTQKNKNEEDFHLDPYMMHRDHFCLTDFKLVISLLLHDKCSTSKSCSYLINIFPELYERWKGLLGIKLIQKKTELRCKILKFIVC